MSKYYRVRNSTYASFRARNPQAVSFIAPSSKVATFNWDFLQPQAIQDTIQGVQQMGGDAMQALRGMGGGDGGGVVDMFGNLKQGAGGMVRQGQDMFGNAVEAVKGQPPNVDLTNPNRLNPLLSDMLGEQANPYGTGVTGLMNRGQEMFGNLKQGAGNLVGQGQEMAGNLVGQGQEMAGQAGQAIGDAAQQGMQYAQNNPGMVGAEAAGGAGVLGAGAALARRLKGAGQGAIEAVGDSSRGAMDRFNELNNLQKAGLVGASGAGALGAGALAYNARQPDPNQAAYAHYLVNGTMANFRG